MHISSFITTVLYYFYTPLALPIPQTLKKVEQASACSCKYEMLLCTYITLFKTSLYYACQTQPASSLRSITQTDKHFTDRLDWLLDPYLSQLLQAATIIQRQGQAKASKPNPYHDHLLPYRNIMDHYLLRPHDARRGAITRPPPSSSPR